MEWLTETYSNSAWLVCRNNDSQIAVNEEQLELLSGLCSDGNARGRVFLAPVLYRTDNAADTAYNACDKFFGEIRFNIDGCVSLSTWLNYPRSLEDFRRLSQSLSSLLDVCFKSNIPLITLNLAFEYVFFDTRSGTFRFVSIPVNGLQPKLDGLKAFFTQLPISLKPIDEAAYVYANQWRNLFEPLEAQGFNPQLYQDLLRSLNAGSTTLLFDGQMPYFEGDEGNPPGTTVLSEAFFEGSFAAVQESDPLQPDGPGAPFNLNEDTFMVHQQSGDATAMYQQPAEETAAAEDGAWMHGKHLRMDPGTGVLNSVNVGAMSQDAFQAASQGIFQDASQDMLKKNPLDEVGPAEYVLIHRFTNERIILNGRHFVVGKSKKSSYQVKNTTTVSRSHAIFVCEPDACWIIDDDSKNGTFINDQRLMPKQHRELYKGDVIRMSDETFVFEGSTSDVTEEVC